MSDEEEDDKLVNLLSDIGERTNSLVDALKLVLLFHHGGPWTQADRVEWQKITGYAPATTKVMCDHIRKVLEDE